MYQKYLSISKNPNCVAYVPQEIAQAQNDYRDIILRKYPKWDEQVAKELGFEGTEPLFTALSAEQIDAAGLIAQQIKNKSGIILADETGVGKGRTLASVYKYCQTHKLKFLFFTYNKDLFSDFVRDLNDIGIEELPNLHVLHNDVVVYNTKEEIVFKSNLKKNKAIIDGSDKSYKDLSLVMTTYSQINSKLSKAKMEFLTAYAKNAVIVLDESHNAAGDSTTRKNIEKLIGVSKAVVYASATFLKNEDEFSLYKKAIDNLDAKELEYLTSALEDENCEKLRSYFTAELVRKGRLIRREHAPLTTKWEHCVVDVEDKKPILDHTSEIFSSLFEIIEACAQYESVYEELKSSWYLAGSHINRVFKNIILLLKIDFLVARLDEDLKQGLKPVVVMESTFASILKNIIADSESKGLEEVEGLDELDESDEISFSGASQVYSLTFRHYVAWIVDKILSKSIPQFGMDQAIYEKLDNLKSLIDSFDASFATLSPIDKIKNKIIERGYTVVEISGRDFNAIEDTNKGTIELLKIKKQPKTLLVNQFNSGAADVAIITRSGSTGFSMHSSPLFKDTRQRVLYELEISSRPQVRVQFIGRVRRKGQLSEPIFKTLITNLPFEARLIEQQQNKMRVMHSHISADANRLIGENILDLYSEDANILAHQFLVSFPHMAFKMGVNLNTKYVPLYFIDMLLKRCVILPQSTSHKMFDYLLRGLEVAARKTSDYLHTSSKVLSMKPFIFELNDEEKETFRPKYAKDKFFALNSLDYKWSALCKLEHSVDIHKITAPELEAQFSGNPDLGPEHTQKLVKFFHYQLKSWYVNAYQKEAYQMALKNINAIKKGAYVSFDSSFGKVFGYIHSIEAPQNEFLYAYPTHYLLELKTLNYQSLPKNAYLNSHICLDLHTLLMCPNLKIRTNAAVEFEKFAAEKGSTSQEFFAVLGNPIFTSYLQKIYSIGYMDYLQIQNSPHLALIVSKDIEEKVLLNLRIPIFDVKEIIHYLLYAKKPLFISPSPDYEGEVILTPSTGFVLVEVESHYNNKTVFDFAMNKVLGSYQFKNGKKAYQVGYKEAAKVVAMFKKRGLNFFKNK